MGYVDAMQFERAASMEQLYELLRASGMGPGWNKPEPSMYAEPKKAFVPVHWTYASAKGALDAAGKFVSTELADRRNLILFNPIRGNTYATVPTLIAAYQMVLPGETARSHRHTPNAMRLVVDAQPGMYTIVGGKKIPMLPGDVLLTPNWEWHGHSNEGGGRGYWIDFLDAPLVHFLGPMFFEVHPDRLERTDVIDERSPARFAWAETLRLLDAAPASAQGYRQIELGAPAMDTVAAHVWRLDAGGSVSGFRTTANCVFAVMDGEGRSTVDGIQFAWRRGDVFAVPAWREHSHAASVRSHLLRVSDEPLLGGLNWLR